MRRTTPHHLNMIAAVASAVVVVATAVLHFSSTRAAAPSLPVHRESPLQPAAEKIADTLSDAGAVDKSLTVTIKSIEANSSGWLYLVSDGLLSQDDARDLCSALADADALPQSLVFVTDADRHLLSGC